MTAEERKSITLPEGTGDEFFLLGPRGKAALRTCLAERDAAMGVLARLDRWGFGPRSDLTALEIVAEARKVLKDSLEGKS